MPSWFHRRSKGRKAAEKAQKQQQQQQEQQKPVSERPAAQSAPLGPELPPQPLEQPSVHPQPAELQHLSQPGASEPPVQHPLVQPPPAQPGNIPQGKDAAQNAEIAEIWAEVQDRVQKLAEHEHKEVRPGMEIGDVISNLDASQEKKEESPMKQGVKTAFGRTLGLIKTVGGIVSDGASTVFAPAGQCYNAISFLINAYDGYQGAFEGLAELLEKCSDHLGRLDYYVKGGMDTRLSKVAAQQLLLFVKICDAALKLKYSAGEKIKTGLKIAFLAENSVQGLLGEMSKLAERERGLVSAQTFALASESVANSAEGAAYGKQVLAELAKDRADKQSKVEKESSLKTLMDVLSFDTSSPQWNSSKQEPVECWQTEYHKIRTDVVPETGEWLLSDPTFQSWAVDTTSLPILGVEGTESTGKSYLASSVVKHLRTDMATKHPGSRPLVAFYFLDKTKMSGEFDFVAKSLVWQYADKDEPYMKSAARVSQKIKSLDPADILPQLLLENNELKKIDASFYIVIDGLGSTLDNTLLTFLQHASKSQSRIVRIFLTGTPTAFEQLKKNHIRLRSFPIYPKNRGDITKFIEARMDKFDALSDTDRVGVAERRKDICDRLAQNTAGDFYKLDTALRAISTLDYMEDINRTIDGAGRERSQQIHDEIQKLNQERSPRQIEEINQIVTWVTFGRRPIEPDIISAVLYLSSGEVPLRPLSERFRTKYLLFEVDSDGEVRFRSSKALDIIPHHRQLKGSNKQEDQQIQPEEIDIVTHFLDKVCPPVLYKKLDLEQYLNQKKSQKLGQIQQQDKDTAHLQLALDCLRALNQPPNASIYVLQTYARERITAHLSQVDLAMVDRDLKSQVGELLFKVFTDEQCIDTFLWPHGHGPGHSDEGASAARNTWLSDEYLDEALRWFKDTAVLSGIENTSNRAWIENAMSGNTFELLLGPSVVRLAHHCLREPTPGGDPEQYGDTEKLCDFVLDYLFKVSLTMCKVNTRLTKGTNQVDSATAEECKDNNTLEAIGKFERWSGDALEVPDTMEQQGTLWHTQMGLIYAGKSHDWDAVLPFRRALLLDPLNWRASLNLAKLPTSEFEAIDILTGVIGRHEHDTAWMQDSAHVDGLAEMKFELGNQYWKREQYDLAMSTFAASIKQSPTNYSRIFAVLERYSSNEKYTAIVSLVDELACGDYTKHLGKMAFEMASDDDLHEMFLSTTAATQQADTLATVYKVAITTAEKAKDHKALFRMRVVYGSALNSLPNRREDKIIRLMETAVKDDFPLSGLDPDKDLLELYEVLGPLYLEKARIARAKADTESAMDYVRRISAMVPEEVNQSNLTFSPQVYVARFYHSAGNHAKARQIVRTIVQIALEILSDDDEGNDIEAVRKLFFVFLPLGDRNNSLAALRLIVLNTRVEGIEPPYYTFSTLCSGACHHRWTAPSEMWVCMDCMAVMVDQKCLEKIKTDEMDHLLCGKEHEFFEFPKWDEERMNALGKGMVPWGDQDITLDQWRAEIKKAYIDIDLD
ncbi:hypothetical protein BJX99DRAFT_262251 [Aspergillus californicus]